MIGLAGYPDLQALVGWRGAWHLITREDWAAYDAAVAEWNARYRRDLPCMDAGRPPPGISSGPRISMTANRIETLADGVTLYLGDCREIPAQAGHVADLGQGPDRQNTESGRRRSCLDQR